MRDLKATSGVLIKSSAGQGTGDGWVESPSVIFSVSCIHWAF